MSRPDFNSAHRVSVLSLDGKVGVFSCEEDPRTFDTTSFPVGSVYFRTDGTTWKRIGMAASDWVQECQQHPQIQHPQIRPSDRHPCPWLQVVRAIQAVSTDVTVLRLIQTMSIEINHEHHH
ncbi:MAG: hypothetical protein H7839_00845 [Magnetococcus sp. YQC-5]